MDVNKIIEYIMTTPYNTNWAVLSSMLDDGDWEEFRKYVMNTSGNMNRRVLESIIGIETGPSEQLEVIFEGTVTSGTITQLVGFNALNEDEYKITYDGVVYYVEKTVEKTGVITKNNYGFGTSDSPEPFYLSQILQSPCQIYTSTDGEHTLKIEGINSTYYDADVKFVTTSVTLGKSCPIDDDILKVTFNEDVFYLSKTVLPENYGIQYGNLDEYPISIMIGGPNNECGLLVKNAGTYYIKLEKDDRASETTPDEEEPTGEPTLQMLGQIDLLMGTEDSSSLPTKKYTISVPAEHVINEELTGAFWYNGQANARVQHHAYSLNDIIFGGLDISKNLESNVLTIRFYYYTNDISIETALLKWYSVIENGQEVGKTWKVFVNGEEPREVAVGE